MTEMGFPLTKIHFAGLLVQGVTRGGSWNNHLLSTVYWPV